MNRQIAGLTVGLMLAAGGAQAVDWSTNLPCFLGGGYDGWDRQAMTTAAGLGGARVSLSSGADQDLAWTAAQAALATTTIQVVQATNDLGQAVITSGGALRLSVPSAWACRFDTGAALTFGGATAKVNVGGVSYTANGRTLIVPVTADFGDGDTLTVGGLKLLDLALCRAGAEKLELDIDGNGASDANDAYALRLSVQHPGGFYDGWDRQTLPALAGLGGAEVSFSSGTNQALLWMQARAALTAAIVRVVDQGSPLSITNGGTIRVSVPSAWACRFDTWATLSFASNAAGKVNVSGVSYSGDGRTLIVPVVADFLTGDTLAIDGLRLLDLALCAAGSQKLRLDFDGDGLIDLSDAFTLDLSVPHFGGFYDGWDQMAMTTVSSLGGAEVSLYSATNQLFQWTEARGALTTLTVRVVNPGDPSVIGDGDELRIGVPAGWGSRFDISAVPVFGGSAMGKVGTAFYEEGGRFLRIPVSGVFIAEDTLTIDGLALVDFSLCPAGSGYLTLNFDGSGTPNVFDAQPVAISVLHLGGEYDGWSQVRTVDYEDLLPLGGTIFMIR